MNRIKKIKEYYIWGGALLNDVYQKKGKELNEKEIAKRPFRYDVINAVLATKPAAKYLEIGVRDPSLNYDKIKADFKRSVDPGLEFKVNPVDFKMTSDEFFDQLRNGKVLDENTKFDVIFIDGLHLADQVDRDIKNSFEFLQEDGFIVLHDCNPPTEWHARENQKERLSPARNNWNGTTWKAFVKWGQNPDVCIACVDTDWGIGVLTKGHTFEKAKATISEFYEFDTFQKHKDQLVNLMSFDSFVKFLK